MPSEEPCNSAESPCEADEPEENPALDASLSDKEDWPSHLDVEIKEAAIQIAPLAVWLAKNGFKKEALDLRDSFFKAYLLRSD